MQIERWTGDRTRCQVSDCTRRYYSQGFCTVHYGRWKTHGDPLKLVRAPAGSGTISQVGYRMIHRYGKQVYEHRVVWEDANGPIPKGHHIHHKNGDKTDNRLENLELLSHGDHIRRHLKGRKRDGQGGKYL